MNTFLQYTGFSLLLIRYCYWIGLLIQQQSKQWKKIFIGEAVEALLLLFIFHQVIGKISPFSFFPTTVTQFVGLLIICIGVGMCFVAKWQLGNACVHAEDARVTIKDKIVTSGIYAWIRHPIYSGLAISYIGAEILAGSWLWVSFLFLFIPAYLQGKKEETLYMQNKQYQKYIKKTKMLIPLVW